MNDTISAYYDSARYDIMPALPRSASKILEIGSGAGATLRWLRHLWPSARMTAVDGAEHVVAQLQSVADRVLHCDLDHPLPDDQEKYDLILALDVLEHLVDPDRVLADLVSRLQPGGQVIVSVPNVARLTVSVPLLLGKFEYQDWGILDRTHLRFFTPDSALELMRNAGLFTEEAFLSGFAGPKVRALDLLTLGQMRKQLAFRMIMRARAGAPAPHVRWKTM